MILEFKEGRKEIHKKYKSGHINASCANGHFYDTIETVVEHKNECPARWIFGKWQAQPLDVLKFAKSSKLGEN